MEKIKLLLYCTKSKPYLIYGYVNKFTMEEAFDITYSEQVKKHLECYNGKIVAECDFEVEEIKSCRRKERDEFGILHNESWLEYRGLNIGNYQCDLPQKSCLTVNEIMDYLYNGGYAIHIKNLNIYDEPRELNFYHNAELDICLLKNAPQNMMYVYDYKGLDEYEKKVLISIRPEYLVKILNKEKTIEIRKKVLKEMIRNDK